MSGPNEGVLCVEGALDVLVLPVELHLRPAATGAPQEELVAREHRGL